MHPRCTIWRYALVVSPDRLEQFDRSAMAQVFALPISFVDAHGTRRSVSEDRWGELVTAAQASQWRRVEAPVVTA
jgi:hypothetical protein